MAKFCFIYVIFLILIAGLAGLAAWGGASFWLVFIVGAILAVVAAGGCSQ